jgi:hypothetical protein
MTRLALGMAAAITIAGSTLAAGGQGGTPYQAQGVIARWRAIVLTTFEDRRASAEEPIMDSIEIVISPGAVKVVQDKANDQRMKEVDGVVQRFAVAMVQAGEPVPDGSVAITEQAIDNALRKICPVYPFCEKK